MNKNRLPFLPNYPAPVTYSDRESALRQRLSGEMMSAPILADPEFARIILKACAYRPEERYQSAQEMRMELETLVKGDMGTVAQKEMTVYLWNKSEKLPQAMGESTTGVMDCISEDKKQNSPAMVQPTEGNGRENSKTTEKWKKMVIIPVVAVICLVFIIGNRGVRGIESEVKGADIETTEELMQMQENSIEAGVKIDDTIILSELEKETTKETLSTTQNETISETTTLAEVEELQTTKQVEKQVPSREETPVTQAPTKKEQEETQASKATEPKAIEPKATEPEATELSEEQMSEGTTGAKAVHYTAGDTIELGGITYTLPIPYPTLYNEGWRLDFGGYLGFKSEEAKEEYFRTLKVPAGRGMIAELCSEYGRFEVKIKNTSEEAKAIEDCVINELYK